MGIIFAKSTGLQDSVFGKSEAPIKAFLEEAIKTYEDQSLINEIFKMISSENYAEKFGSLTSLAQGFLPVGEGGAYPDDERQEGYSKTLEHDTWKDQFIVTLEMIEDSKILDINRTGARGFVDAYALTREKYGASLLIGAVGGTSTTFRTKTVDCKCNDDLSLFSTVHSSITGNTSTQSNKYSNAMSADSIGLVETAMQNYTNDNGETLTVSPTTIIIPNDFALKKATFAALGATESPDTANNGYNYLVGRYNVQVSPFLNTLLGTSGGTGSGTDKPWFMYDKNYNENYNGLLFLDRIPLTVRSYVDDNNDNNVWAGRARFVCGANDWREICVAGVTGGTTLS